MTQASSLSPLITLDYENTLVLAIELSKMKWVLAAQVPGLPRVKAKQTIEPRTEALLAAINGYRDRSKAAGRIVERVVAISEAGWSGFWLARWLGRHGVETHIVQPSSVPVDRLQIHYLAIAIGRNAHISDQHVRKSPIYGFPHTMSFRQGLSCMF